VRLVDRAKRALASPRYGSVQASSRTGGSEPKAEPQQTAARSAAVLPLLGSSRRRPKANQDSPDPEGPLEPPQLQQLASIHASSCHPLLEFAGSNARLCCGLLAQMSKFVRDDQWDAFMPLAHELPRRAAREPPVEVHRQRAEVASSAPEANVTVGPHQVLGAVLGAPDT
jgi:hypothetical protein